ncbi:MAG TPA: hypothetical protein VFV96_18535 [Verrucomicrobiae bacterium]|nr:hypothetical protein [Verrucomicrobiae bacterium]
MNPTEIPPPLPGEAPPMAVRRINWFLFFAVLLAPPVLTLLTAMAGWQSFPVACPFVGGALAGLVCGIQLARRLGQTTNAVVLLSFAFFIVFGALSFALCFTGCLLGNYNFNVH